jgi:thioredoxin-like negative regulator of GroEL
MPRVLILSVALLVGCPKQQTQIAALEVQVARLESRMAALEAVDAGPSLPPPGAPSEADEEAASVLLLEVTALADAGDFDGARAVLASLSSRYPGTKATKSSVRLGDELAVLGTEAGPLGVTRWFTDPSSFEASPVTLVVFFETWCPHCEREIAAIEDKFQRYRGRGLSVIALTKITRSASPESVQQFIVDHRLTFAVGQEDGTVTERFHVQGIPAAALVQGGRIVWRGHPAKLTDEKIAGLF